MAAEQFGAKAVGVEIDEDLVKKSRAKIKERKLDDRAEILQEHLMGCRSVTRLGRHTLSTVDLQ